MRTRIMTKKIMHSCICWMVASSAYAIDISYIPPELQPYYTPINKDLSYPDYPQGAGTAAGPDFLASQRIRLVHIEPHVLKTIDDAREGVAFLKSQGFNALISEHSRYLMRDVESTDDSEFHVLKTQPFDELVTTCGYVAQAAHENGMKFYLHLTYNLLDDDLAAQNPEWLIKSLVTGTNERNRYGVFAACPSSDAFFQAWSNRFDELLHDSNADGAMVDEIQWYDAQECGCSNCIAKFEADTGLVVPPNPENWILDISDPFYKEWVLWRKNKVLSRRMDVQSMITNYNTNAVGFVYSANPTDTATKMQYTGMRPDEMHLYAQSVGDESEPPVSDGYGHLSHYYLHSMRYEMKYNQAIAQKTGNGYWTLLYGERAGSEVQPGWNVRAWLLALSQGSGMWYLQYYPWLQESQLAWEKKHQALLPRLSPYTGVGIPVSVSSQTWVPEVEGHPGNIVSFSSLCTAMQDSHIPHRLITEQDLDSGDFENDTKLLLAMNLTALSSNAMESIRSFVQDGGTVVFSGESSMYDEMGNKRGNFGLSDLIGADYVESVNSSTSFVINTTNNITGDFTGNLQSSNGFVRVGSISNDVDVLGYIVDTNSVQHPGILSREHGLGRVVYFAGYPDAKYFIGHGYSLNRIEVGEYWQDMRDTDYLSLLSKMVHQLVPDLEMQVENLPKGVSAEVYKQDTSEISGYQVHLLNLLDTDLQTGIIDPPPPLEFPSVAANLPDVNSNITIKVKSTGIQGVYLISPDFDEIVQLSPVQSGGFTQVDLPYFHRYAMLYFVQNGTNVITQLAGGSFATSIPASKSIGENGEKYPPVGAYHPDDNVFFADSAKFAGGRLSLTWPIIGRYALGKGGGEDLVTFNFDLDEVIGPVTIDICAKNNNSSIKAPMGLRLNGTAITSWENDFPYNNWAVQRIVLPANLLNSGVNSLEFENYGQGPLFRAPWFGINFIRIVSQAYTIPYSETFESYTHGFAMSGGVAGWASGSVNDALVSTDPALIQPLNAYSEACGYPVPSASHAKVLEVSGTITNYLDMATNQVVWADYMARSLPNLLPTDTNLLAEAQAAVCFNVDDHPAVWHYDLAGGTNRWTVIDDVTVSSGEWARLTFKLDYQTDDPVNNVSYSQVRVNGNLLTNAMAWTSNDGSGSAGGSWFAMSSEPDRLNHFSCKAGGASIDDLVVTTDNPLLRNIVVASEYGQANPAPGTNGYTYGDTITLSITNSTVRQGWGRLICTGWTATGHIPSSGSGTNATLTLTNDVELTWIWEQLPNLSNTLNYAETFESYPDGFQMPGTNGWLAAGLINAVVTTNSTLISSLLNYSEPCGYPAPSASHNKVLEVDGTVSNLFDLATNQIVWVDYMAMPLPGTLPTDTNILAGVQAAVGFTLEDHPAVWHYDLAGGTNRWAVIDDVTVSTGEWVRLTFKLDYQTDDPANSVRYSQVRVNGNLLTNAMAWTSNDGSGSAGGSWFAMSSEPDRLSQFALRADYDTAGLDDLVVTTNNPLAREVEIVSAHGQADPVVGTYSHTYGDAVSLSLTHSTLEQGTNQFAYTGWDMDGHAPATGDGTNITITLTNDLTLTWLWTTNNAQTAQGTPIWWLESHGLTAGDDLSDGDYDGILTWQEWTCDTVPNDSSSVLEITNIESDGAGMKVYWKGGVQATQVLEWRTNLVSGMDWGPVFTNEPPTSITNSFGDSAATNREGFYRFKVWR